MDPRLPRDAASLYVHFPFCETKCHYCDFYSLGRERTTAAMPAQFANALERECERVAGALAPRLDSVFFGGGTPSMTDPADMERALAPLGLSARIDAQTEWTMEANPSSVDVERLRAYRELGVNRVSFGVQALRDDQLKLLGRVHDTQAVFEALESVFAAGFDNVSVDLLCGVPGQSERDLESAIDRLTAFPIRHLSCYLLTLPPHHPMFGKLPGEDTQLAHLLFVDRTLRARGFEHYEISNYCRPGFEARHNLHYWQGASWLGLGPSAHSFNAAARVRYKNYSSLHRYATTLATHDALPIEWSETLTTEQERLERWMLGLRLQQGVPTAWLESPAQRARAEQLATHGLIEWGAERLRCTPRGWALSDQVIAALAPATPA